MHKRLTALVCLCLTLMLISACEWRAPSAVNNNAEAGSEDSASEDGANEPGADAASKRVSFVWHAENGDTWLLERKQSITESTALGRDGELAPTSRMTTRFSATVEVMKVDRESRPNLVRFHISNNETTAALFRDGEWQQLDQELVEAPAPGGYVEAEWDPSEQRWTTVEPGVAHAEWLQLMGSLRPSLNHRELRPEFHIGSALPGRRWIGNTKRGADHVRVLYGQNAKYTNIVTLEPVKQWKQGAAYYVLDLESSISGHPPLGEGFLGDSSMTMEGKGWINAWVTGAFRWALTNRLLYRSEGRWHDPSGGLDSVPLHRRVERAITLEERFTPAAPLSATKPTKAKEDD